MNTVLRRSGRDARILLGGPQGTGLETASQILSLSYAYKGYRVYSMREYFSNIKGRHSYILLRVDPKEQPLAPAEEPDIIAGIDAETIFTHFQEASEGTVILYDSGQSHVSLRSIPSMEKQLKQRVKQVLEEGGYGATLEDAVRYAVDKLGARALGLDYKGILDEFARRRGVPRHRARRYVNTILVAAVAAMTGLGVEDLRLGFERRFAGRQGLVEDNMGLAETVYEEAVGYKGVFRLEEPDGEREYLVVNGNEIVAMGKIAGGLRFQSYYPITPAADESFILEEYEDLESRVEGLGGVVVLQTEDEIAAVTAASGAALAGARAATSTSGPGFDLMVEALGWAGINEVPVVVTYYQRGGPSTGLPTRGGQQDLFSALFSSHGEFPRIVLASGDHVEAFYDSIKALNWAERYQLPVIHLLDKFLANTTVTVEPPRPEDLEIDRGLLAREPPRGYRRFRKDEGPLSVKVSLGTPGVVVWYTGDEHDEVGHINEDPVNRLEMHRLRMEKLDLADGEIPEEERARLYGGGGDFLLVGWGSTKGAALEALDLLRDRGYSGSYLHLRVFEPFPKGLVSRVLDSYGPERVIAVESNYSSMAAKVVTMNTGFVFERWILKWTGRPVYVGELARAVERILGGDSVREVLSYGA